MEIKELIKKWNIVNISKFKFFYDYLNTLNLKEEILKNTGSMLRVEQFRINYQFALQRFSFIGTDGLDKHKDAFGNMFNSMKNTFSSNKNYDYKSYHEDLWFWFETTPFVDIKNDGNGLINGSGKKSSYWNFVKFIISGLYPYFYKYKQQHFSNNFFDAFCHGEVLSLERKNKICKIRNESRKIFDDFSCFYDICVPHITVISANIDKTQYYIRNINKIGFIEEKIEKTYCVYKNTKNNHYIFVCQHPQGLANIIKDEILKYIKDKKIFFSFPEKKDWNITEIKYIKQKIKELCINPYTNELDNKTEIPVIKIARELWLQNKEITENNFIEILRQFDGKISNSNLEQYLEKTLQFIETLDYTDYLAGYEAVDKITENNKAVLKFYINNLKDMWS